MTLASDRLAKTDKVLNYHVQVRGLTTPDWTTVKTLEPRYLWNEKIVVHHFLVWKWETIRTEVHNVKEGGTRCREEALRVALSIIEDNPNVNIRVRETFKYARDAKPLVNVAWENGKWKAW